MTGLDISRHSLAYAWKNCAGHSVTLRRADMSKLSRYRGRFDTVVNL